MTPRQVRKMAKNILKAGPVVAHDESGNGYFAYVIFLRKGFKYSVVVVDEDIVKLNDAQSFLESEIKFGLESLCGQSLSDIAVDNLPFGCVT